MVTISTSPNDNVGINLSNGIYSVIKNELSKYYTEYDFKKPHKLLLNSSFPIVSLKEIY